MRSRISVLPNTLTLCGMFCGFYSILAATKGDYLNAAWAIAIANIFDGLDGWIARLTHSNTRFGIELDSLSDLVTFGIAPAVMIYEWALSPFGMMGWAVAFLFVVCGALRLARYNVQIDSAESKSFTGMPIPAAATIIAALVIFYTEVWETVPTKNYFILVFTVLLSILMVSTLRYHDAKELVFRKRRSFWILVAIVISLPIIVMHPPIALFTFVMLYLIGGIIENMVIYCRRRQTDKAGLYADNKGIRHHTP